MNMNPVQPIVLPNLVTQKVTSENPLNYILFRSELRVKVAATAAKFYIGHPTPPDHRADWEFMKKHLADKQLLHIAGLRHLEDGVAVPPGMTSQEHLDNKNAVDSLKDYTTELEKESIVVAHLYDYIKTVVPESTHITINNIITVGKLKRPREVYEEILAHLKTVCQQGAGNIRERINIEYVSLGMATTKEEFQTLLDAVDHWIKLLEQFDLDNSAGKQSITVNDKLRHLLQRTDVTDELRDIRASLEKDGEAPGLVWETRVTELREACKKATLTIPQLHDLYMKKAGDTKISAEPKTTHNIAMSAASGSGQSSSDQRDFSSYAPQQFEQRPTQAGGYDQGPSQQQLNHASYLSFQQSQSQQPYQQQAFQAQAPSQQPYQQPYQQQACQAQAADQQQYQQQCQQPYQQQACFSAYQGQGGPALYPGPSGQSSVSAAARDVPECYAYPYCNFNAQGCRFRHVTRQGESKVDNDRDQEWHDKERAQGRPGGPRTGVGRPGSLIRQREQSGGGTPARDNKFSRYDAR